MLSRSEISARIMELGIVAVVRTPTFDLVQPVCEALVKGGVIALEITLTVPDALRALREVTASLGSRILLGAGTVLNSKQCADAIHAGAHYVISPVAKHEIIEAAHALNKPVMLGAYTPTEAQLAHEAGADFIKVFPADKLGPSYIKSIRAPLPHLRIVPTGGVDLQTAPEFLKVGCAALGVGSSLITAEILKTRNWAELTRLAGEFVRVVRETRGD
jgi:2-dehydro-3-deoxyphosphogluconate aldolase/(4S)-4-hydroxy-2-oxoglutarate aldolase